jgi:uncharacterized membrane protein
MNWYLVIKFLHVSAVAITIGSMFARQLVRGIARRSDDVNEIASLTRAAIRMDRVLVIPSSNVMVLAGIVLAIMLKWPIFGFLQGAAQNWLLVSNLLLIALMVMIGTVFVPHNRKVDAILQAALAEGRVTSELRAALNEKKNHWAHHAEEIVILLIAALMVLKPF